jgi:hypothetical protein
MALVAVRREHSNGIDGILASFGDFSDRTVDRSGQVTATSDHRSVVRRARVG